MSDQHAVLEWREGGVPVSARFDDPYFSLQDGLAETRHVFLDGNDLPTRFHDGFHIAELGFGTGLNLLAAWQLWQECGAEGTLHYTGFEAFPMQPPDMAQALAAFPALGDLAKPLLQAWAGGTFTIATPDLNARIIIGDARTTLPEWGASADAWFLDGFAPAKNPELWEAGLLAEVARHTNPGGTIATYTAAGAVRRALSDAGFEVSRVPGFGRKRHMTRAVLPR